MSPLEAAHLPCHCHCHCPHQQVEAALSGQERNKSHSDHHSRWPILLGFTFAERLLRRLGIAASVRPSQHTLSKGHFNSITETQWLPVENISMGVWLSSIRDQKELGQQEINFFPLPSWQCSTVCYATLRKALNARIQTWTSMLYSKQHKGKCGSMVAGLLNLAKQITVNCTDTRNIILLFLLSQTCALGQKNQFGFLIFLK